MQPLSRRGFLALGAVGVLAGCSSFAPKPTASPTASELSEGTIIAAINSTRAAYGKPPLRYNKQLEAAARSHALLMAERDKLSHNLGITLRRRVSDAGYKGAVGENLAGGQRTLNQAIAGWLESSSHRDTLLSTRFVEFGLAAATVAPGRKSTYGTYWAFIAGGDFEAWIR